MRTVFLNLMDQKQLAARRRRRILASTTLIWIVVFICAALIATSINEERQRTIIEAQIRTTHAQNAVLQQDITRTGQALDVARSPAEIKREARRWGYH